MEKQDSDMDELLNLSQFKHQSISVFVQRSQKDSRDTRGAFPIDHSTHEFMLVCVMTIGLKTAC